MKKILILALSILVMSCDQEGNYSTEFYKIESGVSSKEVEVLNVSDGRLLTDLEINEIGKLHNQTLNELFQKVDVATTNPHQLEKEVFNISFVKKNGLHPKLMHSSNSENIKKIKDGLKDASHFLYFQNVIDYIYNSNLKTYIDLENFLYNNKLIASSKITIANDYEAYCIFETVLKYSAKFWLDESLGGLGNFSKFKRKKLSDGIITTKSTPKIEPWRECMMDILVADGTSAGASFIIAAGAAALTGPVAPFVFLGEIAVGSGFSSATAYFQSPNC